MRLRNKAVAAGIAAAMTTAVLGVLAATAPIAASAATAPTAIAVTMSGKALTLSTTSVPAGAVVFNVKSVKGDHALQIIQLHSGYSKTQAKKDINAAFGGNKAAIKRIDTKITWLGGVDAPAGHPGTVGVVLKPGSYLAVDQNGNAVAPFDVVSTTADYRTLYPSSSLTTKGNQFHTHTSLALSHDGWMKYHNNAEPHFIVLQHVKQSTTNKDVQDYIASGSQKNPSWGLAQSADAGVISPGQTEVWHYKLPAGKYLIACFWPSIDTGMPHFAMGMWKLVELS
jgi:hypothetical protein